jgi:hypothetical protein
MYFKGHFTGEKRSLRSQGTPLTTYPLWFLRSVMRGIRTSKLHTYTVEVDTIYLIISMPPAKWRSSPGIKGSP